MAAAYPLPSLAGLGWVAPGLILMSGVGVAGASVFRLGFAAGCARNLAMLYWLLLIPFPAGAVVGWLALSLYLALYPAIWMWICWRLFPGLGVRVRGPEDIGVVGQAGDTTMLQRQVWAVSCAAIWVALEMIVARFLSGFPWNLLGVSQYEVLAIVQIASITGVYGISFLMVWFSVALAAGAMLIARRPVQLRLCWGDLMAPLIAVAGVAGYGTYQLKTLPKAERAIRVGLVQPSIPQTLIWDPAENTNRFHQLLALSERALAEKPDLLIWPEAAVPNLLRYEPDAYAAITNLLQPHDVWMILGADDAVPRAAVHSGKGTDRTEDDAALPEFDFYNSSFLLSPDGELSAVYRKRRLVIFGEYIPLVRWFPFLKNVLPSGEGFQAGDRPIPFRIPSLNATTSVLICFEDVFPHLAREYVAEDTDFLLNLTNNGWFGESAAQWQHAANAVFRAVENGLPLVRCANNGLTCWVDPFGGMHEVYFDGTQDIYQAGFKMAEIPLWGGPVRETVYRRHGDWFGWGCVVMAGVLAGGAVWPARKRREQEPVIS